MLILYLFYLLFNIVNCKENYLKIKITHVKLRVFLYQDILSQSYNATVFYFDNISFLEHVLNQLFLPNESSVSQASYCTLPNESSISQASYCTLVLTISFQLFKKQTILWR